MKTFYDIRNDVIVQGGISTTVGFFTETILNDWLDKAHKWAAGHKKWTATEGRISTTYVADNTSIEVGFNYPEGWKPDSIRFLQVGGKRFRKTNFYGYMKFREDFSNSQDKMFTDYGNLYFINPNADVSGTTTLWGQYTPATWDYTDNAATTVFSGFSEEANEALVEEVLSYVRKKQNKLNEALKHHQRAQEILLEELQQIQEEQYGYQDADNEGMWDRIDVVKGDYHADINKRNQWF